MADDGETKDDVKVPDGETGEKIKKLFQEEEKDTSKLIYTSWYTRILIYFSQQTLLSLPPWVNKLPLKPRRLPVVKHLQPIFLIPPNIGNHFPGTWEVSFQRTIQHIANSHFAACLQTLSQKIHKRKTRMNLDRNQKGLDFFFSLNFFFFMTEWQGKAGNRDFCIHFSSRGSVEYGCGGGWTGATSFFLASSYFYHYYSLNVTGKFEHPVFIWILMIDWFAIWILGYLSLFSSALKLGMWAGHFTPK